MIVNNAVVVADVEGMIHALSKKDGHFIGRNRTARSAILATPVVNHDTLYVLSVKGQLSAVSVS